MCRSSSDTRQRAPSTHTTILALILVTGAGLRLWAIGFGLPHPLCRPDEEFILSVGLRFFSGDYNPHFFEWPSLYFYLVHGLLRVVYAVGHLAGAYSNIAAFLQTVASDPTWAHLMLRLISVSAGVLTLLVVHGLARVLFDRTTALVATAFLAVAYLHVRDSHFGVLDVPLTLLIVMSVRVLASAWRQEGAVPFFALAGICAGLASSLKYNAAALLAAALVTAVLRTTESPGQRSTVLAGLAAFIVGFVVCFLVGTPYALLDYSSFKEGLAAQVVRLTEGHGVHVDQVWLRHLTFTLRYGLGLPVLVTAIGGIVALAIHRWRTAAFLCAFPLSYYVVIGSGHTAFIRYTTPLVPFLCIIAAFALRQVVEALAWRHSARARGALITLAVVVLAWPSVATAVRFNRLLSERDTRVLAADWLATQLSGKPSVYESGSSYARPHYAWAPGRVEYVPLDFDQPRGVFLTASGEEAKPDWIVIAQSPLRLYTPVPAPELRTILATEYQLVQQFSATRNLESETSFDRQDAFFLPYADLSARERPGPEFSIYRRALPR